MSQIAQEQRASRVQVQDTYEERQPTPDKSRNQSRELVTAWLLSLLDRQATHGYELHRQLEAHGVTTEISAMYKTLRKLEDKGCAASSWAESVAGPRRRLYRLTGKGRSELETLVREITAARDVDAAFLNARTAAPL